MSGQRIDSGSWLHEPAGGAKAAKALMMTHGAGGNANGAMLIAMADALALRGWMVMRYDLPFRQARSSGPPRPGDAAKDREGLRAAVSALRERAACPVVLGGHSYGGRQASMLLAEEPRAADALLLCSYPLHPPGKPEASRTAHLPRIEVPTLFVHGTKDPFGSPEEMREAMKLVRRARIEFIDGAGHDLARGKKLAFLDLLDGLV